MEAARLFSNRDALLGTGLLSILVQFHQGLVDWVYADQADAGIVRSE
jgi:hypothetical protein